MPTYHHGDLRRALLDATVDIVEERGVNGVNMAEAARRAGVSSGAPYKHFRDKDDLLAALAEYSSALVLAEIAKGTAEASSPEEAFRMTGVVYARWAAAHPELFLISMDPRYLRPEGEGPDYEFWRALSHTLQKGDALVPDNPLMQQLSGRVMIIGLATLFANGIMEMLSLSMPNALHVCSQANMFRLLMVATELRRRLQSTI